MLSVYLGLFSQSVDVHQTLREAVSHFYHADQAVVLENNQSQEFHAQWLTHKSNEMSTDATYVQHKDNIENNIVIAPIVITPEHHAHAGHPNAPAHAGATVDSGSHSTNISGATSTINLGIDPSGQGSSSTLPIAEPHSTGFNMGNHTHQATDFVTGSPNHAGVLHHTAGHGGHVSDTIGHFAAVHLGLDPSGHSGGHSALGLDPSGNDQAVGGNSNHATDVDPGNSGHSKPEHGFHTQQPSNHPVHHTDSQQGSGHDGGSHE